MKQAFLFILLLWWFSGFSQQSKSLFFKETTVDTTKIKIDSILLIGVGSSTTNIFIDDVAGYTIKYLTEKGVAANYYFLGKTTEDAKKGIDTMNKKGYKAILNFIPQSDAYFESEGSLNQMSANTQIGTFRAITAVSRIDYSQNFVFQLCLPDANKTKIWSALVDVSCDLKKSKIAKKTAASILSHFKNNGYIN